MFVPDEVLYHQHSGTAYAYALDEDGDLICAYLKPFSHRRGEGVDAWSPADFDWENAEKRPPITEPEEDPESGEVAEPDPDRERYIAAAAVVLKKGAV